MPEEWRTSPHMPEGPWIRLFQNAYTFCTTGLD
eukprot:CAMPEP_0118867448 /NCGR_PEP_ID=MMETSP1163-20130328/11050_1 /TAXON_ID=124430 /ORGANISM="Phaeomonas parva, Strain CCMP2877" /LENGTH=32 /DNA_ID= /DNA_START= /DNA_END= /DNA_ORIENTATION=